MEKETCIHCGANLEARWERLSPLLARSLLKFHAAVIRKQQNCVSPSKEVELSKTEYNNFQKLRYHGLIAKVKTEEGDSKSGYWLITRRGNQFLQGSDVPLRVKIFRNRIVDHDGTLVNISQVLRDVPYLDTIKDFQYEPIEIEFDENGQGKLV